MPTANEVVQKYLEGRKRNQSGAKETEVTKQAALEIVGALPDGFTIKDARACVKAMLTGNTDTAELSANARGRIVTKTLDGMVNDGSLRMDEEGRYTHADPTTATVQNIAPPNPVTNPQPANV